MIVNEKKPLQYKTKLSKRKYSRTWIRASKDISLLELFIVSKLICACIYHCHYRPLHPLVHIVPIFNLFLSLICIISNLCSLSDIHLFVRFDQNWYSNEFSRKNDLKLFLQNHWDVHWLHVLPNVGVEIENTRYQTFQIVSVF